MTLTFSLTFAVIFLLMSFYLYHRLAHVLQSSDNASLLSRAETLLAKTELSPLILPIAGQGESISIAYKNGKTVHRLFSSHDFPSYPQREVSDTGVVDWQGKRIATVKKETEEESGDYLVLSLAKSNAPLEEQIHLLSVLLSVANLISIFFASTLSYLASDYLVQPIKSIISFAKETNAGKKIQTLPLPVAKDELYDLTETLNGMFRRIEDGRQQQHNFFASAAHELRTPLSILKTSLEVALKDRELSVEIRPFLETQLQEINRLGRLVEDFLLVSQLKNPELLLRKKEISLDELVLEIADKFGKRLRSAHLRLHLDFDHEANDFVILADRDKLANVLINLFENVIKYAPSDTDILLKLRRKNPNGKLVLEVQNKILHSIQNIEKLSQQFYQADVLQDGYGMGLWIANKVLDLHQAGMELTQEEGWFRVRLLFDPFYNDRKR